MRSGKVFRDVDLQLLFDLLVAYRAMYNISGTPAAQRQVLAWQHKDFNTCIPAACARNVHIKIIRQSQRYCDQSQYICPVFVSHVCFLVTVSSNMTNQMKQREEQMDGGKRGKYGEGVHGGEMGEDGWRCGRLVVLLFTHTHRRKTLQIHISGRRESHAMHSASTSSFHQASHV